MTHMFRRRWYFFVPLIIAAIIGFGFVVMALWNYTMPAIFHLPTITYWQAVCLLILSRIFFGSGHGPGHHRNPAHLREKWEKMSPEQREKFYKNIKNRCYYPGDFYREEPSEKKEEQGS
jgi:hypothetical protein